MSQTLAAALRESGRTVQQLASAIGVSRTAASRLANHGQWPKQPGIKEAVTTWCRQHGVDHRALSRKEKSPRGGNRAGPDVPHPTKSEDTIMLLRKQALTRQARQAFGLDRDPFAECREQADVFISGDIRYVREAMLDKVRHGGFLAVVGESGSGKTTLREEMIERLQRDDQAVIIIQPYVLAMEGDDNKGRTLKASHIAESILRAVQPLTTMRNTPEARFAQIHTALRESARAGHRHVLVIEEAHCLPIPTLKHLKRFLELKDGLKPLIAIILLGQPELAEKLSEQNPEVREVVQRIEIATLAPLDQDLERYVQHRLARVGVKAGDVLADGALQAIRERLTGQGRGRGSMLYPLAVGNLLARAMNIAAELGAKHVTADMVRDGAR